MKHLSVSRVLMALTVLGFASSLLFGHFVIALAMAISVSAGLVRGKTSRAVEANRRKALV